MLLLEFLDALVEDEDADIDSPPIIRRMRDLAHDLVPIVSDVNEGAGARLGSSSSNGGDA